MKKLILIIMIVFLFAGCNQFSLMFYDYTWQIPEDFKTTREVMDFVAVRSVYVNLITRADYSDNRFTYVRDPSDECLLPDEFYYRGYGDCEDFALMLQFLFEVELGYSADLILGYYDGSSTLHAWVESDGAIYETLTGEIGDKNSYEPVKRYKYPDSAWMVETFGGFLADSEYNY